MTITPIGRTALGAAAATLAAATLAATFVLAPSAYAAAPALTATFAQSSTWSSGYAASYTIRNGGDATANGWVVEFDLAAGSTISTSWDSVRSQSGQRYRFANAGWNGTVAPGATQSFGFNVSGLGTPTNCTLNGAPCTGGPPPTTPPPTTAPPSTPPPTTAPPTTPPPTTSPPPSGGPIVNVSTAAELRSALAAAQPGQTIRLAAGTYRGSFVAQRAGTASARITLTGPRTAVLINDGPSGSGPSCPAPTTGWDSGYGVWLFDAPYWNLTGFTVAESKKGIMLDNSHHVTIDGVYVHHTEEEGVHFRRSSADGILRNSQVEYTGLVQPGYGEGVYLGSAQSNFACHGNSGGIDRSDRVQVLDNRIGPYVTAEHIDIKEGTEGGVVRGNTFDGRGITGQNSGDSWVDAKGNGYLFERNTGSFSSPGTFANGYETHNLLTGYGCGNIWRTNSSNLGGVGRWAINVTSTSKCPNNPNIVHTSNTVTNALNGLTNIPTTP
ncbi:cellulose binding domain-containing protein [Micromonospora sp. NBC_01699]|uniref:cellulose binding domain-containing protein n=1 Tax=Micromonospora sp. NBC_01699 TaxID=2975984 RepID=UPI002E2C61E1|nr:cellulose binding domain-containing protein [Micromonospora sp. NBC_01699]